MKCFFVLLLSVPGFVFCQGSAYGQTGYDKTEINKNIFRATGTLSSDADGSLAFTGSYEREIKKPFTVFLKAGPSFTRTSLLKDAWGNEQYRFGVFAMASGELRYYFNLNRRIRHQKITRNFSAGYFSIEPFVRTNSFTFLNKGDAEETPGDAGAYINLGYQKQINETTFYGAFFGTRFPGRIYSHSVTVLDIIRGGISIGRVF